MIPRDGVLNLDQLAEIVSSAPAELGILDTSDVCTVAVQHPDGRWLNHYTVLRVGVPTEARRGMQAGSVKLARHEYLASQLVNRVKLLEALTSWQDRDLTGSFQPPVNTMHHGSNNYWGKLPCWVFDANDNSPESRNVNAPRGPFKDRDNTFFAEDLGAAVQTWTSDPTSQDSSLRNVYRTMIPDRRGYFESRSLVGRTVVLSVAGSKIATLTCAFAPHRGGAKVLQKVIDGRVEFLLPEPAASWEVYLFDDSDSWCDHYHHRQTPQATSVGGLFSGGVPVVTAAAAPVEQSVLDKVEALQEVLIDHATGKPADEEGYRQLRKDLLAQQAIVGLLPGLVKKCRSMKEFWRFIQPRFATYKERRAYLWSEFRPLLDSLEGAGGSPADRPVADVLERLDSEAVYGVWSRALERRMTDPEGAVTMARTLLETVCKHILEEAKVEFSEDSDLPQLYRLTAARLNVAPSQHTEKVFKQILGGATAVVEGLGALRNRLGDAHGKRKKPPKPTARHAQLAVNLAGAVATFLVETWQVLRGAP